jgi:putative ABC transport system permease protein
MRELGLFLAMGARRGFIFRLIVMEALCIAGTGGLLGVLLGFAAVWFGRDRLGALIGNLYVWADNPYFFQAAGLTLLAALVTGGLGGLYPAWRVSRLEPYEAIRRGD